jgi:hypothetical protein
MDSSGFVEDFAGDTANDPMVRRYRQILTSPSSHGKQCPPRAAVTLFAMYEQTEVVRLCGTMFFL